MIWNRWVRSAAGSVPVLTLASAAAALPPWPFSPLFPTVRYEAFPRPNAVIFADLDGVGGVDMIDAESDAGVLSVRFNNGLGFFWTQVLLPTGGAPMDLAAGDLDGDLDIDLVSANRSGNSVTVYLNNGGGGFAPRTDYPAGPAARALVLADVDGNGSLDIVVANESAATASVLLNTGFGAFGPPASYAVGTGPASVSAADIDGDGDVDIAVGTIAGQRVSLLRNAGGGLFAPAETLQFAAPVSVRLQDIDGDFDADMILIAFPSAVEIHANDGTGAFTKIGSISGGSFRDAEAADMNGDGLLDLVAVAFSGLYVARAAAPGVLNAPQIYAAATLFDGLAVADINGDGAPDVAAASAGRNSIHTFWNNGAGRFADYLRTNAGGTAPGRVVTGDVDADGDTDVVISYTESLSVLLLRGLGDGLFAPATRITLPFTSPQKSRADAALANIDADPDPELLVAVWAHDSLLVYDNDGAGNFALVQTLATSDGPTGLALFDVDGDADIDAVTLDAQSPAQGNPAYVSVFLNDGAGAMAYSSSHFAWADQPENIAVGDVNGDLLPDIVITDEMSRLLVVIPNTGGGTFGFPSPFSTWENPFGIALADVDGDLDLDAVVTRNTPTAALMLNSGNGEFAVAAEPVAGAGPGGISSADLDGDGDVDFVIGCYADQVTVLINLGGGSLASTAYHYPYSGGLSSTEVRLVALADLDADTDPDIIVAETGRVHVLPNQLVDSGLPDCPGDINDDGEVLVSDFVAFAGLFGSTVPPNSPGDLNGDGAINAADFTAFVQALNSDCP